MTLLRTARHLSQVVRRAEFREKLKRHAESLVFALLILCVFTVTFYVAPWLTIDDELLRVIVSSTAIVVGLIVGFLFNSYFHLKQMRFERLSRFVRLQDRLRLYQEAFRSLSQQLVERYRSKVDFQLNKTLRQLARDIDFAQTEYFEAVMWVHAIWDVGSSSFQTPDFELTDAIVTKERLQELYGAMQWACSLLTREKRYKYVLKTLGFQVTSDFDQIFIADSQYGLQYVATRLLKKNEGQDFRTLRFWQDRFEECLDLLERMKAHGRFIYSFVSDPIRKLSAYLLFVSIFGIVVPLVTLSASRCLLGTWRITLSTLSFIGFLLFFSTSLLYLYRLLTSRRLLL